MRTRRPLLASINSAAMPGGVSGCIDGAVGAHDSAAKSDTAKRMNPGCGVTGASDCTTTGGRDLPALIDRAASASLPEITDFQ